MHSSTNNVTANKSSSIRTEDTVHAEDSRKVYTRFYSKKPDWMTPLGIPRKRGYY